MNNTELRDFPVILNNLHCFSLLVLSPSVRSKTTLHWCLHQLLKGNLGSTPFSLPMTGNTHDFTVASVQEVSSGWNSEALSLAVNAWAAVTEPSSSPLDTQRPVCSLPAPVIAWALSLGIGTVSSQTLHPQVSSLPFLCVSSHLPFNSYPEAFQWAPSHLPKEKRHWKRAEHVNTCELNSQVGFVLLEENENKLNFKLCEHFGFKFALIKTEAWRSAKLTQVPATCMCCPSQI